MARLEQADTRNLILVTRKPALAQFAPSSRMLEASLHDIDRIAEACQDADVVYQLAWSTTPHTSNANPVADFQDNALANLRIIDRLAPAFKGRLIFTSSGGAVYGIPQTLPIPESHPIHPLSAYGISKSTVERYLELYGRMHNLDYTILRLANPYGSGQRVKNAQGVIPAILNCLQTGEAFTMWGDGSAVRDYVHITDVVSALVLAGCSPDATRQSINIGSGQGKSLHEIIELIERLAGHKIRINRMAPRREDVPVNLLDVSKARALLAWTPKIDIETGFRELVDEALKHAGKA